ncbi:hypothetical protein LTR85_010991 [Meristemomyces frigidus]|nr:hypothetical protein LTR85_010991 [Meristemomyces frigidus]
MFKASSFGRQNPWKEKLVPWQFQLCGSAGTCMVMLRGGAEVVVESGGEGWPESHYFSGQCLHFSSSIIVWWLMIAKHVPTAPRQMGKRRRERDRPKAALDAPYNPNKRILLSYASDDEQEEREEQEELPAGTGQPTAEDEVSADYKIPAYPDDEQEVANHGAKDAVHALNGSGEASEVASEAAGEADGGAIFSRGVTKNISTGQWPALGSLSYQYDEDEDEDGYDSTEEEAMAYLRAVRSERQSLPEVLAASRSDGDEELYESGLGDNRGYLSEGTYVARPTLGPAMPDSAKTTIEPQEAYTNALKKRFLRQREQMHSGPSKSGHASLDDIHPISCPPGNNKAYAEWNRLLKTTAPLPAQIRSMDQETVYALLAMIQKMYLVRGKDVTKITSAWLWSLLARLDDVGTMSNDQVFEIREFGKKAVLVQLSLHNPDAAQQLEAINGDSTADATGSSEIEITGEDLGEPKDGKETKVDIAAFVEQQSSFRQNTLATLDMVVYIVGEVFRQRDLLEFRRPWLAAQD